MGTALTARRLRVLLIAVAILLGALFAWANRYAMGPDGISYLDIGDAFVRGDWAAAVNGLWSPLYPLVLGLGKAIFRPDPQWEFPFVHYVNFAIFLAALASFDFFLRQLLRFRDAQIAHNVSQEEVRISPVGILAVGFVLFIWSSLNLPIISQDADVTPDRMVATFTYLAAGVLLRTRMHPERWAPFALLGGALGLGYLAKAPMFPLALVFFALAVVWVPLGMARRIPYTGLAVRAVVAVVTFALVASPLILGFSRVKGRITLGDSARLNYLWRVNHVPWVHWQGGASDYDTRRRYRPVDADSVARPWAQAAGPHGGTPKHPTRMITARPASDEIATSIGEAPRVGSGTSGRRVRVYSLYAVPAAYEFATPVGGTYPPWFDPSYWYEGLVPRFDAEGHLWAVLFSLKVTSLQAAVHHWTPSIGLLAVLVAYVTRKGWMRLVTVAPYTGLWVPPLVAFGMFSLVRMESRYVEALATILWLGVIVGLVFPAGPEGRRVARVVVGVVLIAHLLLIAASAGPQVAVVGRDLLSGSLASPSVDWQVAEGLMRMGVKPEDKVAILGRGWFAYWARLARVRIVGEVLDDFWAGDAQVRQGILTRFASVGAKVVVATPQAVGRARNARPGEDPSAMGWQRVGDTEFYAMPLVK